LTSINAAGLAPIDGGKNPAARPMQQRPRAAQTDAQPLGNLLKLEPYSQCASSTHTRPGIFGRKKKRQIIDLALF
jgi:hypothetical protein